MKKIRIKSFAKLNLGLRVLGKRWDGYHEIMSPMCRISLFDIIEIKQTINKKISIKCTGIHNYPYPEGLENIVHKAVSGFLKTNHLQNVGLSIHVHKQIPIGAGLGGGSSNAAFVLMALNKIFNTKCKKKELMDLGAKIGSDVPFFLYSKQAIATGTGINLEKINLGKKYFLLLNPGYSISTQYVYNHLNTELTLHDNNDINKVSIQNKNELKYLLSSLRNDLEKPASIKFKELFIFKELLLKHGALQSAMSGSGTTVFGVFKTSEASEQAFKTIEKIAVKKNWLLIKAESK